MNVCVIGLGYVGLTLALTLADCGITVFGVDAKKETVSLLKKGISTISEKGTKEILQKNLEKKFHVSETIPEIGIDAYIICVGTPLDSRKSPILDYIISSSKEVGKKLVSDQMVILRSTLPVGITRKIVIPVLEKESGLKSGDDFDVIFAPERTAEGVALEELKSNPQIIGSLTAKGLEKVSKLFKQMTPTLVPVSSIETAEIIKLIDNTYRDVHFAYANEIAIICEFLKIDAQECIEKANFQYPRNKIPVPSPGVGGPCLSKDPYILTHVANQFGYQPNLIKNSRWINEYIPVFLGTKITKKIELLDKEKIKIFILGFAFKGKPETSDLRDSSTLLLLDELKKNFPKIFGYDPMIDKNELEKLGVVYSDVEEGFNKADCIILMNNHESYNSFNMKKLLSKSSKPCIFVDCWSMFKDLSKEEGIIYTGIGLD